MEDEGRLGPNLKFWISTICGIVGIVLIAASFFVYPEDDAHRLFFVITRWIMVIAGSFAVVVSVVAFFLIDSQDVGLW